MKAPKISHTVAFEKPDSAHASAACGALNPGFASSSGPKNTNGASTATRTTPIRPIAAAGQRLEHEADDHADEDREVYHACCGNPSGAGISAISTATAIGAMQAHAGQPLAAGRRLAPRCCR